MKFYLAIKLMFAVLTMSLISCGNDSEKELSPGQSGSNSNKNGRIILVMGDYDYPPFEYNNENGVPSGFNIDIMHSIADAMHMKVEIKLGKWSEVRKKLENGEIDILAGMFKTPAREKEVDFSEPYFISNYSIFVREDSDIKGIEDIKGREVIVQEGDLGHDFILDNGNAGRIITKSAWSNTLTALSNGEGDCAIVAVIQGLILIEKLKIENVKPLNKVIMQKSYCIAVRKGNRELLTKLNEGLNAIRNSGEYDRIYDKWFGIYELKKFISHPYFMLIIKLFIVLIISASAVYAWNIMLQRKVKEKVKALNNELQNSNRIKQQLQESMDQLAKAKEEALKLKAEAEMASEAKSFFLAGVSHELRTPLNGIIGMTNLLYNTDLTQEQRGLLDMLNASSDNLFRLMADLLEFSRVASGKFKVEIGPVNLGEFVNNTASIVKMLAEEKGLIFEVRNSAPEVTLLMDKDRLGQVVFNLVGNAVKYTERGGVVLEISYTDALYISVTDTGIGIDNSLLDDIFKPFTQASSDGSIKNRGLGLGLAIVRLLVENFEGSINVESHPGKGSTFTVKIPCRKADPDVVASPNGLHNEIRQNMSVDEISMLIVEDDQISRVYLEKILQRKGWNVDTTDSGYDAVVKSKQKRYHVILMDINLPGLDGLKATELIREFEKKHGLCPSAVIAVTAHAYPEVMAKCVESGMDGYLSKPFSMKILFAEIEKIIKKITAVPARIE